MKLTSTIVECSLYAIVNHVDSDYSLSIPKAAAESAPLICTIDAQDWESRDTSFDINEDLENNFKLACMGEHQRWKLVKVQIRSSHLLLVFADTESLSGGECDSEIISFSSPVAFSVLAEHPGNTNPDEYIIKFFGEFLEGDSVATIEERHDSVYHALDSIRLWNGKYYLDSYCYN